jgi:hypothetical protein
VSGKKKEKDSPEENKSSNFYFINMTAQKIELFYFLVSIFS